MSQQPIADPLRQRIALKRLTQHNHALDQSIERMLCGLGMPADALSTIARVAETLPQHQLVRVRHALAPRQHDTDDGSGSRRTRPTAQELTHRFGARLVRV